jgi:hypothetical protein
MDTKSALVVLESLKTMNLECNVSFPVHEKEAFDLLRFIKSLGHAAYVRTSEFGTEVVIAQQR